MDSITIDAILESILAKEGGFVDHPDDRGGATNWGITERVAREHGYEGHMRDLERDEAKRILTKSYWVKPGLDQIADISMPVAVKLADMGVNMGTAFAARTMQRWLNAFNRRNPRLETDGVIGPRTIDGLNKFIDTRGAEGEVVLVRAINCTQGHRYLEITEGRQGNESFIYGWMKNRVQL